MVKVIWIGMYNSDGKFVSNNWYEVLNWIKVNCDSLIIYCHIEYKKLKKLRITANSLTSKKEKRSNNMGRRE